LAFGYGFKVILLICISLGLVIVINPVVVVKGRHRENGLPYGLEKLPGRIILCSFSFGFCVFVCLFVFTLQKGGNYFECLSLDLVSSREDSSLSSLGFLSS